jgi:DNA-binding HxlR family transcriptional regulator
MSNEPLLTLIDLCRHRWIIPLINAFSGEDGARFAVLLRRLPISRESLTRTLQAAIQGGWITRAARSGHPLRPEYRLSEKGKSVIGLCARIEASRHALDLTPTSLTRWSLPIVRTIGDGCERFSDIERALPTSNPRALAQSLKAANSLQLIKRNIVDLYPPSALYALSVRGAQLANALVLEVRG